MRRTLFLAMTVTANCVGAWNSIMEMENDICVALTNDNILLSTPFTNQLHLATGSPSEEMKSEAHMLLAINAYQNFLITVDQSWLCRELSHASNAVAAIGTHADKWQYWMARFLHASAFISTNDYVASYAILTNALDGMAAYPHTNLASLVEGRIMDKFEMPGANMSMAFKVFAGMSAAELGMGGVATNYANQVPLPYRNTILEFVR